MAIAAAIQREWGWYMTASGGTGNVQILPNQPNVPVRVCGIACGGSATTDVVTIYDGNNNPLYSNVGGNIGALSAVNLAAPIRVNGLNVTFAGGTNGVCYIYTPSMNA